MYLRGADGEDLTHVIQQARPARSSSARRPQTLRSRFHPSTAQVTFTLHPSFSKAVRTLTHPPYEVSETGWGEFEIGITARSPKHSDPRLRLSRCPGLTRLPSCRLSLCRLRALRLWSCCTG